MSDFSNSAENISNSIQRLNNLNWKKNVTLLIQSHCIEKNLRFQNRGHDGFLIDVSKVWEKSFRVWLLFVENNLIKWELTKLELIFWNFVNKRKMEIFVKNSTLEFWNNARKVFGRLSEP